MARNTGRTVHLRHNGLWANKPNDSLRPVSVHPQRADAIEQARQGLRAAAGGDLVVKDPDGTVQSHEVVNLEQACSQGSPVDRAPRGERSLLQPDLDTPPLTQPGA